MAKVALLSAFDKAWLDKFARELVGMGWEILASGGTAKYLAEKDIKVRDIAEIVGEPILGHRVVTLSRQLHAALLSTESEADAVELTRIGVPRIDLVYVNFYPLQEEIEKTGATLHSVIEKTDIGGPTMLRSAAKGRRLALCKPTQFKPVLDFLNGKYTGNNRIESTFVSALAAIAEQEVSDYCRASAEYLRKDAKDALALFEH